MTGMSGYAYEYQLNGGYISLDGGYRVGICGELSHNRDGRAEFATINTVCIRVPQDRMLYSNECFKKLYDKSVYNTCVISPSGCGKTTFLKNFVMHLNETRPQLHICIADERGELSPKGLKNSSIMTNCNKSKAVEYFVRCMNPDVIVFDEVWSEVDFTAVHNAMQSGVPVVFSIHGTSTDNLVFQNHYKSLSELVSRVVILSKRLGPGTIEAMER